MIERPRDGGQDARRPRLALVLGAGGVRGIAHVGVLQALAAFGCRPDAVVGVSSGALVGACHAVLGWEPDRMAEAVLGMGRLGALAFAAHGWLPESLAQAWKARRSWPSSLIDAIASRGFEDLRPGVDLFGVTCYDLLSQREMFFRTGAPAGRPPLVDCVAGSAALPVLCPSRTVAAGGRALRLVDGGLSRTLPVGRALDPPVGAMRALAIDLRVATGFNERRLDHQDLLKRRYADRLLILKPDVVRFGTILAGRKDAPRLLARGREALDAAARRWLEAGPP